MNRPPVENTCCHHECANGENDYQKSTKGRDRDYHPYRCKCQPSQYIDIIIQRENKGEYNRWVRKQTVSEHHLDSFQMSVTALSVVMNCY